MSCAEAASGRWKASLASLPGRAQGSSSVLPPWLVAGGSAELAWLSRYPWIEEDLVAMSHCLEKRRVGHRLDFTPVSRIWTAQALGGPPSHPWPSLATSRTCLRCAFKSCPLFSCSSLPFPPFLRTGTGTESGPNSVQNSQMQGQKVLSHLNAGNWSRSQRCCC